MKKANIHTDDVLQREIAIKKVFVGRDKLIKDFYNDYYVNSEKSEKWNLSVTNYYGIPGIGKSKLLYKIYDYQRDRGLKSIYFRFDNNISVLDNVVALSCTLSREYGFRFELFDLAYVHYCKLCGKVIEEKSRSSILDNDFMNTVLPLMEVTKPYGVIANILEAVKAVDL